MMQDVRRSDSFGRRAPACFPAVHAICHGARGRIKTQIIIVHQRASPDRSTSTYLSRGGIFVPSDSTDKDGKPMVML